MFETAIVMLLVAGFVLVPLIIVILGSSNDTFDSD